MDMNYDEKEMAELELQAKRKAQEHALLVAKIEKGRLIKRIGELDKTMESLMAELEKKSK